MTKQEITKAIYKQKPRATLNARGGLGHLYVTKVVIDNELYLVSFNVPLDEIEGLKDIEPAMFLLDWMVG